jgi:hypothetical protein
MSQTIGMELQRVTGQQFSVLVQELSSAYAGCLMGTGLEMSLVIPGSCIGLIWTTYSDAWRPAESS